MKYLIYLLAALLLHPSVSFGIQRFSFEAGVKGGRPSPRPLERHFNGAGAAFSGYYADDAHHVVGPSFAFIVDERMGVQVDLLYKPFDIHSGSISPGTISDPRFRRTETLTHAKSWETATLFRYAFTTARIRPFAIGGFSFHALSGESETRVLITNTGEEVSRSSSRGPIHVDEQTAGLVIGGGAEARLARVRFAPEFRYIRRGNDSPQNGSIVIPSNQFEFLVGVSYL